MDKNFVASLQKGMEVLTCFGRQHSRLTVSEVARLTGGSPASARRSLLTLRALGYLDSDGKRFWLLPKVLLVAHAYLASRPTPSLAQPLLDALSERTRESASLGTLLEDDAIIIARSTARRSLSIGLGIGSRLPAYCSALGRVLLASLPSGEAERRVHAMPRRALTPRTVFEADAVLALVDRCRDEGYAGSDGELELGVRSMAVPVLDRDGATVAGMSIAVRSERMELIEFRDAFLPTLRKASAKLTARLYPG
ncbi:IclR family transcriptional regulator domain-containing protein [Variovorax ginsengisoli]|uniref:IclR family transcriptional regulator C-terminal domain-containing protein n=1 Tax=Variovorax ginsengisoli TaxID=363844 RepID=A0ABT8S8G1_9BURK|nr:IclR family transcriptional regulator C-terminal domain-containing protein [Variovorax ginsengisoli]MDN8616025.1 IclR family transcriptional regulator C-terminal domain-containing protein [Variovorax ginsengisoli]MDO1535195.1 IclR family transcriptional regulator C-terminal domain-containing protein [Variovorax ginsengisoli]